MGLKSTIVVPLKYVLSFPISLKLFFPQRAGLAVSSLHIILLKNTYKIKYR